MQLCSVRVALTGFAQGAVTTIFASKKIIVSMIHLLTHMFAGVSSIFLFYICKRVRINKQISCYVNVKNNHTHKITPRVRSGKILI